MSNKDWHVKLCIAQSARYRGHKNAEETIEHGQSVQMSIKVGNDHSNRVCLGCEEHINRQGQAPYRHHCGNDDLYRRGTLLLINPIV